MQLYHNNASPFCRKVEIVAIETGQNDDILLVDARGHTTDPGTLPIGVNPIGKIPTLTRDDGPALFDSRVICRFLSDRANAALYPAKRLYEVMTLEALADGMLDAATLMVYEVRSRPEEGRHPPWVEGQWKRIERALDALESRWMSHLNGPLDIGQIAVACALGYLDFRHADRNWRRGHDELTRWFEKFSERASMQATTPRD